jgi:hypothetical protein
MVGEAESASCAIPANASATEQMTFTLISPLRHAQPRIMRCNLVSIAPHISASGESLERLERRAVRKLLTYLWWGKAGFHDLWTRSVGENGSNPETRETREVNR